MGIGQGRLGLGERDYYVSDDAQNKRVLEAYKQDECSHESPG